jgi:phage-related protein
LISGVIRIAWSIISGVIEIGLALLTGHWSQAWNSLKSTVSNVLNGIMSLLSNLGSDAFNFGKNFVSMMAKGITSAVGAVTSAVSSVASSIKGFLGFHSPTELGPAADSDKWGPNFVNMMAQGIHQHTPAIQAAVNGIALNMKTGVTAVNNTVQRNLISVPAAQNSQRQGMVVNINIDGRSAKTDRELTDMIANKFYKQMGIVSL